MEKACIWIVPLFFYSKAWALGREKGGGLDGQDFFREKGWWFFLCAELLALNIIQHYQKECITVYTLCPDACEIACRIILCILIPYVEHPLIDCPANRIFAL